MIPMKKWLLATAVAASVFTAGCGGGSDDGASGSGGNGSVPADFKVAGPLDALQTPLSENVLAQLSGALAGTPLESVIGGVDRVVVKDVLDIVDALALGLQRAAQDPSSLAATTADVRGSLVQLARDLQGLLGSLAGATGGNTSPGALNPLAGTPLAGLGAALQPILGQITRQVGSKEGEDLNLSQLAQLVAQLNQQLQIGLAAIPPQAAQAPVLGGVFTTLSVALNDVSGLLNGVGSYSGPQAATAVASTLNNLRDNVLTRIIPLEFAESANGQPGTLTTPVRNGITQLSNVLKNGLTVVTTPVLEGLLAGALEPLLDPVENGVLPLLLNPIIDALNGGSSGGGGDDLFAGTPLAGLFGTLGNVLSGVLAPLLGPLDPLLNPLCKLPLVGTLLPSICRK